jgi:cyclic pyranopterin phosphate synthase
MAIARKFSHLDASGKASMVDVGHKAVQFRRAIASGKLHCAPATIRLLKKSALPKGDVLGVARIAAIQAVKRTPDLIPLCHPLPVNKIDVQFKVTARAIEIECRVETEAKTGVEMEALTGVSVAALTLYDMCKAVDKTMQISDIHVVEKIKVAAAAKKTPPLGTEAATLVKR